MITNNTMRSFTYVLFLIYNLQSKGVFIMPQTKFQDVVYTIIMVCVMVYAMVCYNVAIDMGGLSNEVFLIALHELPIMGAIGFILEFFIVGNLAKKLAFRFVDPAKDRPIVMILSISAMIVCLMCPIMSFIASVLFNYNGASNIIANWLKITVVNFPMAMCFQIFYAGPFVRLIFRNIFKKQLAQNPVAE